MSQPYTICNLYIAPQERILPIDFTELLRQLPPPCFLVGDFNARHPLWGDVTTNPHGHVVHRLLLDHDLCILNDGSATHFHRQTGTESCIDLTLVSSVAAPTWDWSVVPDLHGSDHYPILFRHSEPSPISGTPRFRFSSADWAEFYSLTTELAVDLTADINAIVQQFQDQLFSAAVASIPQTSGNFPHSPLPWWTSACSHTQRLRKAALRRYRRTRSLPDKVALNRASAIARFTQRKARSDSWKAYVSTLTSDTPLTRVWKRIRNIKGTFSNRSICLSSNGVLEMDPQAVANTLAEHVSTVSSSTSYSCDFRRMQERREQEVLDFSTDERLCYNDPIGRQEVRHALRRSGNTAPGQDNIHYELLRHLSPPALDVLVDIFNKVWLEGLFPDVWSRAVLLPFRKPGKDPSNVNSYRPIALTSCLCKLLEKVLNLRLMHHLEANNLLSEVQYGFRKGRCTSDSLARLETAIQNAFSSKRHIVAVFFDIAKAYDTTWRHHILSSMHSLGIRGCMGTFVSNFIRQRCFQVKVGDSLSDLFVQEQGVPQGSVLSVTLFAIAINGIVNNLPVDVHSALYVDDLVIYYSSSHLPSLERKLQLAINRITSWTQRHGFSLSAEKTVAVHFHRRRGIAQEPMLSLLGRPMRFSTSARFLGMIFDQRLTWSEHIAQLKTKCLQALGLLRCLSHQRWGSDRLTLLRLYRSLVRSKLDYGCWIYGSASARLLNTLNSVHNEALRICLGAFRSSLVASLYVEATEMSLERRRMQLGLQHLLRLQRLPNSLASTSVLDQTLRGVYDANDRLSAPVGIRMARVAEQLHLPDLRVLPSHPSELPPWHLPESLVCDGPQTPRKQDCAPSSLRMLVLHHQHISHDSAVAIYTDGSKSSDGAGFGVFSAHFSESQPLPLHSSIFTAELSALLSAVQHCDALPFPRFVVYSDSRSALQALSDLSTTHSLVSLIQTWLIRLFSRHKIVNFCWVPSHVGLAGNERADKLAKAASISDRPIDLTSLPHTDYYGVIRKSLFDSWQQEWTATPITNKLRNLRPLLSFWPSSNQRYRFWETKLARLRLGHTRLTHGYLMEGRRIPPYCDGCVVPLTVYHILIECPDFVQARVSCFGRAQLTLSSVLGESPTRLYPISSLFAFLERINLLDLL